jgi:NADH-quinone oxidoreductase subunit K
MALIFFLLLANLIFFIAFCGFFINRKNLLILIMSIELMLLSVNFFFIISSIYLDDRIGQLFTLFILTVAATESAIGLAILLLYYRVKGTISIEYINFLKG